MSKSFKQVGGSGIDGIKKLGSGIVDNQIVKDIGNVAGKGFDVVNDNVISKGIVSAAGTLKDGLEIFGIGRGDEEDEISLDEEEQINMQEIYERCKK